MTTIKPYTPGFTLIEMLVTIIVVASILAVAVPSYHAIMVNNKASAMANEFTSAIMLARSEAVKRGLVVSLCAQKAEASVQCATSIDEANNWRYGWLVFTDQDTDGNYNSDTDTLIARRSNLDKGAVISAFPSSRITYNASGFLSAGKGDYQLTPAGCAGDLGGRLVSLSAAGRADVTAISCNEDAS